MKQIFLRWVKMNSKELILLVCSCLVIIGTVFALKTTDDTLLKLGIILISFFAEIILAFTIQIGSRFPLSTKYAFLYLVSYTVLMITDFIYAPDMGSSNRLLYISLGSGGCFLFFLSIILINNILEYTQRKRTKKERINTNEISGFPSKS